MRSAQHSFTVKEENSEPHHHDSAQEHPCNHRSIPDGRHPALTTVLLRVGFRLPTRSIHIHHKKGIMPMLENPEEPPIYEQYGTLSALAGCLYPDTAAGKEFLYRVAYCWLEERDQWETEEQAKFDIVDGNIPWNDYNLWLVFADLGVFQIDPDDVPVSPAAGMREYAIHAIGVVGENLIAALQDHSHPIAVEL